MNLQEMFNYLKSKNFSEYAAAAVLANAKAESDLKSNNVENISGIGDESYTRQIDEKNRNFIDGYGYGLFQWTYSTRKAKLLETARKKNVSVSDAKMQLDFMISELASDFPMVYAVLNQNVSFEYMTEYFMKKYENPADQSATAIKKRVDFAREILKECANSKVLTGEIVVNGVKYRIEGVEIG